MENVLPCSGQVNVQWTMCCHVLDTLMFNGQRVAVFWTC